VRRTFAALLACALVAFVAFPRPAAADDTLTLIGGSYAAALFEVLIDAADQGGYFKEEHLNVNVQYAGNPSVAIQAVEAGKGDIASGNINGIVIGYERGVRMVAFMSRGPHLQGVLGVLDSSPIRTLSDFKGKTIGETTLGQPGEVFAAALLAGAGLKRGDYSFAPIGSGAQAVAAIASGKVDAVAQPYPALRIYEVTTNLKFRYFFQPVLNDVPDDAFFATPATIANKADLLKRFCRAIVKASIFIREQPQLAAKYFVVGMGAKMTDQTVSDQFKQIVGLRDLLIGADPLSKTIGAMPLRGMKIYNQFMQDNGLTAQLVPAEAVSTNQFTAYANDFDHAALVKQLQAMR
jgi:NitT/TauT family transport system substrate-binding protein